MLIPVCFLVLFHGLACILNWPVHLYAVARRKLGRVPRDVVPEAEQRQIFRLRLEHDVGLEVLDGAEKGEGLKGVVEVGVAGPDGRLQHGFMQAGLARSCASISRISVRAQLKCILGRTPVGQVLRKRASGGDHGELPSGLMHQWCW